MAARGWIKKKIKTYNMQVRTKKEIYKTQHEIKKLQEYTIDNLLGNVG